jgi:hypothetical protein
MLAANYKKGIITLVTFLFIVFLLPTLAQTSYAAGAYGWFAPKVNYISPTPASLGCTTDESSIEFWLANSGTQNRITSNSGPWTVNIIDNKTSMQVIRTASFPVGRSTSTPLCFNPNENGLQIVVKSDPSSVFHPYEGPTLFPSVANLDSMKGKHFRGFLELELKSDVTPSVESTSANGQVFSGQPTLKIKTNSVTSSFGAKGVNLTRFYIRNAMDADTTYVYSTSATTTLGSELLFVPPINATNPALPEGIYFWTFQQELNGATTTRKTSAPAYTWTFSQIPSSGAPSPLSFTIDRSAPTSTLNYSISSVAITSATVKITNEASDLFGNLGSSKITIYDGAVIHSSSTLNFVNTNDAIHTLNASLVIGKTYTVRATTTDSTGHVTTSETSFTLSGTYAKPIIDNLNLTDSVPHAIEARIQTNGSNVTSRGSCWSTSPLSASDFLTSPSAKCTHSTTVISVSTFNLSNEYNSIPVDVQIFMMVYAKNLGGTTTEMFSKTLLKNATNTLPVIKYEPPTSPAKSYWIDPGILIEATGADSGLLKFGVCSFVSATSRDTADIQNLANAASTPVNCRRWGATPTPNNWAYRAVYANASPNQTYFYKLYAQNSSGWAYDTGEASTAPLTLKFDHLSGYSPYIRYTKDMSNFNNGNNTYNTIDVRVAAVDSSSDISTVPRRIISFTAKLFKKDGAVLTEIDSQSGTTTAHTPTEEPSALYHTFVSFTDVPLGTYEIVVSFTGATNIPVVPASVYDSVTRNLILTHPSISFSTIVGDETSTGSSLIIDPQVKLWATPSLIRAGQSTTLNWSMNDVGADLQCEIAGPKTFSPHIFTANTADNLTGTTTSPSLQNTQLFKLKCENGTEEFSTTTRVNTIGTVQEI